MDFSVSLQAPPPYVEPHGVASLSSHPYAVVPVAATFGGNGGGSRINADARRQRHEDKWGPGGTWHRNAARVAAAAAAPTHPHQAGPPRTTARTLERLPALAGDAYMRGVTDCIRTGRPFADNSTASTKAAHGTATTARAHSSYVPVPLPPIASTTTRSAVRRAQLRKAAAAVDRPSVAVVEGGGRGTAGGSAAVVRGVSPALVRALSSRDAAHIVEDRRRQATSRRRGPEWMEYASTDIMHAECVENARLLIARATHLQRTSLLQFTTAAAAVAAQNGGKRKQPTVREGGNRYTRHAEELNRLRPQGPDGEGGSGGGGGGDISGPTSPLRNDEGGPSPPLL